MDLTVLYTKTSTTVPDNCGILGALRNQDPAVTKIVHSIVHKNQYFINCTQYCTQKLVLQSQTAGFWEQRNPKNTAEFLEWIFQTAGFWFQSAPKIPRLSGTVVLVFVCNTVPNALFLMQ
jgi:hypothetical protein